MPSFPRWTYAICLVVASSVLWTSCRHERTRHTITEIHDKRLDGHTFYVVALKENRSSNLSRFAHSVHHSVDSATLYYARFEIKPAGSENQVVAVATDCKPLLTDSGEALSYENLFLSGAASRVVRLGQGTIRACEMDSGEWRTLVPRGAAAKLEWYSKPRNYDGTRIFSDGVIFLDGDKAEYVSEGDFLTAADYALMSGRILSNCPCMTASGDEIIFQPGGGSSKYGYNEFHVASRDGKRQTLKSPLDGVLLAADRVHGALTLVLREWGTGKVCVWNTESGQVWRYPHPNDSFEAWDPRTGHIILSDFRSISMPLHLTSDFVLWHYQEAREEKGRIEWPEMFQAPGNSLNASSRGSGIQ